MRIEEITEKLQSKDGLLICGHTIKMIPSASGSNDLVMADEGRYIVRGIDEYTIDFSEEKGIIFGSFSVCDKELPGESGFSFIYDIIEAELFQFNNTYMLSNIGFDEPVGVFGNRLMTFDLEKKEWVPRLDIPNMYYCRAAQEGILYLSRPFSIRKVEYPQIIDKDFSINKAPEKYASKYLWGLLRSYMIWGARCDEELESWIGLRVPKKNSISLIREYLKTREDKYQRNRMDAFKELLEILSEFGVKDDEDITSLLITLISICFQVFEKGAFMGFPNKIFNTFFKRIIREYRESTDDGTFSINNPDIVSQIFEPYIYWTDEKVSELEVDIRNPFSYMGNITYKGEFNGKVGRLCFDEQTKRCNPKYEKTIYKAYICEDYLIKTIEDIRGAKESSKYIYADIAYNILTKQYVVSRKSSPKVTDSMISEELGLLKIKKGFMDFGYKKDSLSELYTEESEEGLIDIIGDSSATDDCKTTYKAYIGYAKEIENSKLEFHKYNVSDGVEKDNVWDIDINEKNEYTIGYNPKSKKHMIRSEKIRPEIISTLKRTFGIKRWIWERDDEEWMESSKKD